MFNMNMNVIITNHGDKMKYNRLMDNFLKFRKVKVNFSYIAFGKTDAEMIVKGYEALKHCDSDSWMKLHSDSTILNEEIIANIFGNLFCNSYHYAGHKWRGRINEFATDFFFADSRFMHFFIPEIKKRVFPGVETIEQCAYRVNRMCGGYWVMDKPFNEYKILDPVLGQTSLNRLEKAINEFSKST